MVAVNIVLRVVAVAAVAGMLFSGAVKGQQCKGDIQGLTKFCSPFVKKGSSAGNPTPACCTAIKTVDVRCACQHITADVEKMIDMAKVVRVAAACGKPLAHGSKCGSYTVP